MFQVSPRKRSCVVDGSGFYCLNRNQWALNSAVECHPHTVEVIGSNPIAPTIELTVIRGFNATVFSLLALTRKPQKQKSKERVSLG